MRTTAEELELHVGRHMPLKDNPGKRIWVLYKKYVLIAEPSFQLIDILCNIQPLKFLSRTILFKVHNLTKFCFSTI